MLQHYLKIMYRNLWKSKLYSTINIAGLALGLTCCMLIVLYNKDEKSYDQFHKNKNQLYRVVATTSNEKETHKMGISNGPAGPAFKEELPEVKAFVRVQGDYAVVKNGTEIVGQDVVNVDSNFFSVFSFPLLQGNATTVLKNPNSLVITDEMALKYFGTTNAMGKVLEFKNGDKFELMTVTGVSKKSPQNSSVKFDMLRPFTDDNKEWISFFLSTYILLDKKADAEKVAAKFDNVFLTRAKDELKMAGEKFGFKDKVHFGLQPFTAIHLDTEYSEYSNNIEDASKPIYSYILSGIAIFILLIACINFINLKLAHSLQRAKEIGIRKVVGSQRRQLIKQFLGESFLLSLIAFVMAIALTLLVLPVFNELSNKQLNFSALLDTKLLVAYIILFLTTGFVAGFYPALVLSGFNPLQTIYNRQKFTGKNYLTKGLVVFQFALATFLIITTVMVYAQFNFITHKDLGYNDNNTVLLDLGRGADQQKVTVLKNELAKDPAIKLVAASDGNGNITVGKVDGKEMDFAYKRMDENYLNVLQIPLVKGRSFSENFPGDSTTSVVINETFAKQAGWNNPIGKQVDFFWDNNRKVTVVGVVKDYHFESLQAKIMPLLFVADPHFRLGQLLVKLNPANIAPAIKTIAQTYKKIFPLQPYKYTFMDVQNKNYYKAEAKWKQIITYASILSIFICCIGLFGLSILATEKRTKEIGIRKVLGASVQTVVSLLSVNFVKLVLIAFIIAAPTAWYVNNQWLQNFPYRVSMQWQVFILAGGCMVLLAFATISYQSIKAALMNPIKSLKSE
jgi:putative ABC transport system permease protein